MQISEPCTSPWKVAGLDVMWSHPLHRTRWKAFCHWIPPPKKKDNHLFAGCAGLEAKQMQAVSGLEQKKRKKKNTASYIITLVWAWRPLPLHWPALSPVRSRLLSNVPATAQHLRKQIHARYGMHQGHTHSNWLGLHWHFKLSQKLGPQQTNCTLKMIFGISTTAIYVMNSGQMLLHTYKLMSLARPQAEQ